MKYLLKFSKLERQTLQEQLLQLVRNSARPIKLIDLVGRLNHELKRIQSSDRVLSLEVRELVDEMEAKDLLHTDSDAFDCLGLK